MSFTVTGGYSDIQLGPHSKLFFDHNGGYIDGAAMWRLNTPDFPLLLGVGLSGSGYSEREHLFVTFPDGTTGSGHLYSDVGFFSLEARAAIPLRLGRSGFFVMPQIGAGLLVDSYSIDTLVPVAGNTFIETEDHDGAAFDIRPGIQLGYSWDWASVGADLSYMAAWGDFGQLGNSAREFRAGVFFRVRF
jgi:hypothetical protein